MAVLAECLPDTEPVHGDFSRQSTVNSPIANFCRSLWSAAWKSAVRIFGSCRGQDDGCGRRSEGEERERKRGKKRRKIITLAGLAVRRHEQPSRIETRVEKEKCVFDEYGKKRLIKRRQFLIITVAGNAAAVRTPAATVQTNNFFLIFFFLSSC